MVWFRNIPQVLLSDHFKMLRSSRGVVAIGAIDSFGDSDDCVGLDGGLQVAVGVEGDAGVGMVELI